MRLALTFAKLSGPCALMAGLAGCGETAPPAQPAERGTAAGQVLGGTVSDAMIPLDTVRSVSPVDPTAAAAAAREGAQDGGAASAPAVSAEEPVDSEDTPAPADTAE